MDTFSYFRMTLEKGDLNSTVVPLVSKSSVVAQAWATSLSLVLIDGGHSFEAAFTDYNCWARHIMPGGFLLIHDIFTNPDEDGQAPYQI